MSASLPERQGAQVIMRMHRHWASCVFALALACGVVLPADAQVKYDTGQNVQPAFDGWVRNPDGTVDMYFGYLNRNYVEEPIIPIGPDNTIEPGGPDRGQPTFFLPRRQRYVFSVRVPKDWDPKREVVWTLTANGRTGKIYGSLIPHDEIVERNVLTNGGFGALEPGEVDENQPPTLKTSQTQSVALPGSLTLSAALADDGLPKPRAPRVIRSTRDTAPQIVKLDEPQQRASPARIIWMLYRGPAPVTFEPNRVPAVAGKEATTNASFSAPGTYVLRAFAHDGQFRSRLPADVTVTVTGGSAPTTR